MRREQLLVALAFAAVYIIWGSTYLAAMFGVHDIPPMILSGSRFLTAALLLYIWRRIKNQEAPSARSFRINFIAGTLTLFGGTVSVTWAVQYISTGLAAIIVTCVPFWFIILDRSQWSFYFSSKLIIVGLIFGFLGVSLLVGFDKSHAAVHGNRQTIAAFMVVLGGIAWAFGSLYAKYKSTGNSLLVNASVQLMSAGLVCLLISVLTGEWKTFSIGQVPTSAWLAFIYLAIMGSVVAYSCYLFLLKVRPAAQVSTYVYVNPVVALLLGAIFLHEALTWIKLVALGIILCGVCLVNMAKNRKKDSTGTSGTLPGTDELQQRPVVR